MFGDPEAPTKGDYMPGMLFPVVAHDCINRLMYCLSEEVKKNGIAVVTLMPGFMRTERVERSMTTREAEEDDALRPERERPLRRPRGGGAGRRPKVKARAAASTTSADLAEEYGFTDVDGTRQPRFQPF